MKIIMVGKPGRRGGAREVEVPETYDEGYAMLVEAMNPYYAHRGGDRHRTSVVGRVAFGLFRPDAPHPTAAINLLMQELCLHEGEYHHDPENAREDPRDRRRRTD